MVAMHKNVLKVSGGEIDCGHVTVAGQVEKKKINAGSCFA